MNARAMADNLASKLGKKNLVLLTVELLKHVDIHKIQMLSQACRGLTSNDEEEQMDKVKIAEELVKLAKDLVSKETPEQALNNLVKTFRRDYDSRGPDAWLTHKSNIKRLIGRVSDPDLSSKLKVLFVKIEKSADAEYKARQEMSGAISDLRDLVYI